MIEHGHFVWNELLSRDAEGSKAFYAATLGWTYEGMPMPTGGTYWIAKLGDKSVAGIMDMPADLPAQVPTHWFSYIEVDDVDARLTQVTEAGGRIMRPAWDIQGVGRITVINDATGGAIGLMASVKRA